MSSRTPSPSAALGPPAYGWLSLRLLASLSAAPALFVAAVGCREDAEAPSAPEATPLAASATHTLAFYQVSAGGQHTCGITTDNRAYCWGENSGGQVGDGSTTDRLAPVAVAGTRRFRQVSAGDHFTCGVTTDYRAYCWGGGHAGELGDGTGTTHLRPVPVAGGHRFREVDAGDFHSCAVSYPDRHAYCWGYNADGESGDGTTTNPHLTPVAVSGGHEFRQVRAGGRHTCGVTTSREAFCWGENLYGEIGDGSEGVPRIIPTLVAGGRRFVQVDVGISHSCGVTPHDRAFCWGYGGNGQVGDGGSTRRLTPVAVAGGLSFERVSAGDHHTCGETTSNRTYCWGDNDGGQLGDRTKITRLTPVAVVGGHFFSQLSAGAWHTCARTPAAVAYCWGDGGNGRLGNGSTRDRVRPVAVASGD